MNSREEKSIALNPTEILRIRGDTVPEKVIDEGDSLDVSAKTHSFYWGWDVFKRHDYEPVAVSKVNRCCLTRVHYHGIVVWQGYSRRKGKPIVFFSKGFHVPTICSKRNNLSYLQPRDLGGRMALTGYLISKIRSSWNEQPRKYNVQGYSGKLVNESVPHANRFTWDDINYYVLVAPAEQLEDLNISKNLRNRLLEVRDKEQLSGHSG